MCDEYNVTLIPRLGESVGQEQETDSSVLDADAQNHLSDPPDPGSLSKGSVNDSNNKQNQGVDQNMFEMSSKEIILNHIQLNPEIEPTLYSYLYSYIFGDTIESDPEAVDRQKVVEEQLHKSFIGNDDDDGSMYEKYFDEEYRKFRIEQLRKQLEISPSAKRFGEKFLNQTEFTYYFEKQDDIDNNYDMSNPDNISNIVSFQRDDFINIIYETYPSGEDIVKQFVLDFPRQKVWVNGKLYKDINDLFFTLSKHNRKINTSARETTTLMLSLLLMCQSSFYMSFAHIHHKVAKMKEKLLSDSKTYIDKIDEDPRMDYFVTDMRSMDSVHLTINEKRMCCTFSASYRIVNVSKDKTIYQIDSETVFDMDYDECLIIYEAGNQIESGDIKNSNHEIKTPE